VCCSVLQGVAGCCRVLQYERNIGIVVCLRACAYVCVCVCALCVYVYGCYGVATISRLLKIIGLFCKILSLLWGSFAKETNNLKESTNRSHL